MSISTARILASAGLWQATINLPSTVSLLVTTQVRLRRRLRHSLSVTRFRSLLMQYLMTQAGDHNWFDYPKVWSGRRQMGFRTDRKSTRLNSSHRLPYTTLFRSGRTMAGNDQLAFYSVVTGYYSSPSPTATPTLPQRNPISLVAYAVSNDPSGRPQLVRLSKGLVWQAANGFQDRSEEHTSELQSPIALHDALPIWPDYGRQRSTCLLQCRYWLLLKSVSDGDSDTPSA